MSFQYSDHLGQTYHKKKVNLALEGQYFIKLLILLEFWRTILNTIPSIKTAKKRSRERKIAQHFVNLGDKL